MCRVDYSHVRAALSEDVARLRGDALARALPGGMADLLEEIAAGLDQLGRAARRRAPGVIQGAATGALTGGPAGAVLGGLAGGVAAASGTRTARASTIPRTQRAVAANPAALQLLLTVLRPEVVQALVAMALGPHGAAAVRVGDKDVPVASFANLVQTLAGRAAAVHHARFHQATASVPAHLAEGGVDIATPAGRGAALLRLLAEHPAPEDDDPADEVAEPPYLDDEAEAMDLVDACYDGGLG